MRASIKWSHALILFAIFPLGIELAFIGVMFEVLGRLDYAKRARLNSINTSSQVCRFMTTLIESGAVVVGADVANLKSISNEQIRAAARNYSTHRKSIDNAWAKLVAYLTADPRYWDVAETLEKRFSEVDSIFKRSDQLLLSGDSDGSIRERVKAIGPLAELRMTLRELVAKHASNSITLRQEEDRLKSSIQFVLAASFAMSLLSAAALAFLLNRTIAANLRTLADNVENLAAKKPIGEHLAGTDEFAVLDSAFRSMFRSVTEVQNSEKMIVESAADLICSLDLQGLFLQVNSASQRLLGYEPAELIGHALHEIVVVENREFAADALKEAISSTKETAFELKMQAKNGQPVEMAWLTVWSESEQTLFCVAHDLSQRRQTERVKQEITAMISHDLRTPISSIQVAAELFARGIYGEFPPALSQRLVASTAKTLEAMDLINDLLDIEKFDRSTAELSFDTVPVNELINAAWRDVIPQANEKGIKLIPEAKNVEIVADRDQFVRVLRNLLRNSIVCSPPDSEVIVSAGVQDEDIIISIEDAGPLVPDSEKECMFDRFQSTEKTTSSRVGGMRLALCVCKALIEAHGGELYTSESSRKKFKFVVSIPV